MNDKLINKLKLILITEYNHWVLFTIALGFLFCGEHIMGSGEKLVLYLAEDWLFLSIFPLISAFLRRRIEKDSNFIVLQLLCSVFFFVMVIFLVKPMPIILGFATFEYMFFSFYKRFVAKEEEEGSLPIWIPVAASLVFMVILHHYEYKKYDIYFIGILIAQFGFYLLIFYLKQYFDFVIINTKNVDHLPARAILRSGMSMVLIYSLISCVILVISLYFPVMEGIVYVLKIIFYYILKFIVTKLFKEPPPPMISEEEELLEELPEDFMEPSLFWEIFGKVVYAILMILFIAAMIYLAVRLIKYLINLLKRDTVKEKQLIIENDGVDVREKCEVKQLRSASKNNKLFQNVTEKIRYSFKKHYIKDKKEIEDINAGKDWTRYTAYEYAKMKNNEIIAHVYEKARYSDTICTKDDLKQLKEAYKKHEQ